MNAGAEHGLAMVIKSLQRLTDEEKFHEGGEVIEALRQTISEVAEIRAGAIRRLRHDLKLQEVADLLGVSPQRIAQMVDR
jgi:hypothetical protein